MADGPCVQRTLFATPRAAEFLEPQALQAQTGQPMEAFGDVVVKELLDNALDATESAGRPPVIEIEARTEDGITYITVTDNGDGIAPETVTRLYDFNVLVSDKARYRGPTRGALGNALKTLIGIPYALALDAPVVIDSRGVRHELRVSIDAAGEVVVERQRGPGRDDGTAVSVPLPDDLDVDIERWAFGAALVNPHATITAIDDAYGDDEPDTVSYESTDRGWSKWTPNQPSNPHWYDSAAFTGLVYAYIHQTRRTGIDVPLGAFIAEFEGLKATAKQKAIRHAAPGITHLSQLQGRDDLVAALHAVMCEHAKPTPPLRLGVVGADHYRRLLHEEYGLGRSWYKSAAVTANGVPWIIEVFVAETGAPGRIFYATNHAARSGTRSGGPGWTRTGSASPGLVRSLPAPGSAGTAASPPRRSSTWSARHRNSSTRARWRWSCRRRSRGPLRLRWPPRPRCYARRTRSAAKTRSERSGPPSADETKPTAPTAKTGGRSRMRCSR
ncbi:MAG TPA: ATP-binding protein [Mycobacterium sp.]|nr:ATP-binding protein [Mycobacterium sp.]